MQRPRAMQEMVLGPLELATSLLVHKGEILDAITTTYDYQKEEYVVRAETPTSEPTPPHLILTHTQYPPHHTWSHPNPPCPILPYHPRFSSGLMSKKLPVIGRRLEK